ncbi:MAG: hypothetical protein ACUVSC_13520 [Candidatus Fervidibacter sp.]|uniref:hypothetical protein n=1 Tax=Candidatus Fervidibacter sp. TaxID=3100871 RepID=UPI00404A554F
MQREVPIWVAVVAVIVVILIVVGVYWFLWHPRVQEGATPSPGAPIFKAGPGLGGEKPAESPSRQ